MGMVVRLCRRPSGLEQAGAPLAEVFIAPWPRNPQYKQKFDKGESMTTQDYAYIAGSAHLDIIASVTGQANVVDKIGTVQYEFGGTAYNFAMNLQLSGVDTVFTGAFNHSPISQMILTEMMNQGIRTHVKTIGTLPEAGFCAQLVGGDLYSAVSSMPVEHVTFGEDFFKQGMGHGHERKSSKAKCLVLDCNLSGETLNKAAKVAKTQGVGVYVAGVSEAKCVRILEIQHPIEVVFVNATEMSYLVTHVEGAQTWEDVAKHKNCAFVVTQGANGVTLCEANGQAQHFSVRAIKTNANTLGAGDMFSATFIKTHAFEGKTFAAAIEAGIQAAANVLERENASLGRQQALNSNIESIASRAEIDNLTELLNRDGLERFMRARSLFEKPFYIILCDVDHFKNFNDTYGHDVGDEVLQKVGKVIKKCIRNKDAVGRWGGEEFVCLIDDASLNVAQGIAERIRTEIAKIKIKNVDHGITLSAGVAFSDIEADWGNALKAADQALYQAKENGRNQVVVAR